MITQAEWNKRRMRATLLSNAREALKAIEATCDPDVESEKEMYDQVGDIRYRLDVAIAKLGY